ncbi:MAG: NAD(P)-dependent oxidoreductase [Chloroflexota bacterium]|nr:NAD(P)-dependent oxidoreductase [Chloroflexota bacterium]
MKKVGVIGLGNMGRPIARNIAKGGFEVAVYDINQQAVQSLVEQGATVAQRPADVAMGADLVITVLPDGPDVLNAMLGEEGVYHAAKQGMVHADFSTVHPKVSLQLHEEARSRGIRVLDAAMARSVAEAEVGTLVLMVGGAKEDLGACMPVFSKVATNIHHCGQKYKKKTKKLVNNLLGGVAAAASIEALLIGQKAGLSPEIMLQVLATTGGNNAMLHGAIKNKVLTGGYETPAFALDLQHKDARLAMELAADVGAPVLIGALVQQIRQVAKSRGLGRWDTTAIATVYEELAGTELRNRRT